MDVNINTSFDYSGSNGIEWGEGGDIVGKFTLTYTVSGSALIWYLSFAGSITYDRGRPTGEGSKFYIEAGNDFTNVNLGSGNIYNGDWSGTLYPNKGSGTLKVGFQPGYPGVVGNGGPVKNLISMNYSGVTTGGGSSSSNLSAEVTIPQLIAAGSTITVTCEMHGPSSQSTLAGSGGLAGANSDSVTGVLYELLSSDGSTFRRVKTITSNLKGSGTHLQRVDIPLDYGDKRIKYELVVSYGADSITDYSDAVVVKGNNPPSTPEHLYVPSSIAAGERIDISWTPSTDADNNLDGYFLEYSTNGGVSWDEVYRGPALETTHYISEDTKTIRYRVRAYDVFNAMSAPPRYAPSTGDIYVNNNHAPTTPATITVSPLNPIIGQAIIINWGASSDPDGDDFDYVLERAVDSTTNYTVVYTGKNLNWTDTCGSWGTVTYRVKAVDIYGAYSNYKGLTEPRTVISNAAPTITCVHSDGADLGEKTDSFNFTYSVDDENASDVLTIEESIAHKVNNDDPEFTVKKTINNAVRDKNYKFEFKTTSGSSYWTELANGAYFIKISVSDGTNTVSRTFAFLKNTGACVITLTNAIETVNNIESAVLSVCGSVPEGGFTAVQVTADEGAHWEECQLASDGAGVVNSGIGSRKKTATSAMNEELLGGHYLFIHTFTNTGTKFNFRIQVEKVQISDEMVGGYISSVQGTFIESSAT